MVQQDDESNLSACSTLDLIANRWVHSRRRGRRGAPGYDAGAILCS